MKTLENYLQEALISEAKYTPEEQQEMVSGVVNYFVEKFNEGLAQLDANSSQDQFWSIHAYQSIGDFGRWHWDWLPLPNESRSKALKACKEYIQFIIDQLNKASVNDVKSEVLNKDGSRKWANFNIFTPRFMKPILKKGEELEKDFHGFWGELEAKLLQGEEALKNTHYASKIIPRVPHGPIGLIENIVTVSKGNILTRDIEISSGYLTASIMTEYGLLTRFCVEHTPEQK